MLGTPLKWLWRRGVFGFCQNITEKRRLKEDLLTQLIQKSLNVTYLSVKDTTVDFGSCMSGRLPRRSHVQVCGRVATVRRQEQSGSA